MIMYEPETINGYKVLVTPFCLYTKIVQTRKLKRKRKNRRWVKKFRKRYSIKVEKPGCYLLTRTKVFVAHPVIWERIKPELEPIRPSQQQFPFPLPQAPASPPVNEGLIRSAFIGYNILATDYDALLTTTV